MRMTDLAPLRAPEQRAQRQIALVDVGDGLAVSADVRLVSTVDGEDYVFLATALGGRVSTVAGFVGGPIVLGELGRMPLADVRAKILAALEPAKDEEPAA